MLLPDSMEARVCVPFNSRSTAWVSFDGRGRVELKQGDHIKVTASKYPFPTVCHDKQSTDWFHAISRTLKWNDRERQKSFVVVEEGPEKKKASDTDQAPAGHSDGEEEEEEEEEQEERFDIDDLSSNDHPEALTVDDAHLIDLQVHKAVHKAMHTNGSIGNTEAQRAAEALLGDHIPHNDGPRSGIHSGVDSPSRFIGGSPPHPSHQYSHMHIPRHVQFSQPSAPAHPHHPHRDDARTPTATEHRPHRSRSRHRTEPVPPVPSRAFAYYGQDESDSAPSDNDL